MISEEMDMPDTTKKYDPLKMVLNKEIMEELKHSCEILSPPYRETAVSYFVEGKTTKEIAALTNTSIHTVNTRLLRARKKLQSTFGKEMLKE